MAENRAKNRYTNILACKIVVVTVSIVTSIMCNQMIIRGPNYHLLMMILDLTILMEIIFR